MRQEFTLLLPFAMVPVARNPHVEWRRDPESNRARRICNPPSAESAKYATEGKALRMQRLDGLKCLQLSKNLPDDYRRIRPVRQPRNHGQKAVNPYSNIGPNLATLSWGLSEAVPTIRLNDVLHKTACACLIVVIH